MADKKVRLRIAPSPTGDPHVGTGYMALFNTAFAYFHMGMASSMVVIFFAIVLGVALLAVRIRRATWI